MSPDRIRVAVVFGGRSGEHPVSCISAAGVLANIDTDLFDTVHHLQLPVPGWDRAPHPEARTHSSSQSRTPCGSLTSCLPAR